MIDAFTEAMFAENLNTTFYVRDASNQIELKLVETTSISTMPHNIQFSIVFQGPPETILQQKIYKLDHERLGELDLFLVPIAKNDAGFQYEAVFNQVAEVPGEGTQG